MEVKNTDVCCNPLLKTPLKGFDSLLISPAWHVKDNNSYQEGQYLAENCVLATFFLP